MSRALERVRHLLSQIEEVQRQGQSSASEVSSASLEPPPVSLFQPAPEGKVSVAWNEAVTLELTLPSGESIQVRKLAQAFEFRFADGKAFHIPFKNVA